MRTQEKALGFDTADTQHDSYGNRRGLALASVAQRAGRVEAKASQSDCSFSVTCFDLNKRSQTLTLEMVGSQI